jgi:hypothetical protein
MSARIFLKNMIIKNFILTPKEFNERLIYKFNRILF